MVPSSEFFLSFRPPESFSVGKGNRGRFETVDTKVGKRTSWEGTNGDRSRTPTPETFEERRQGPQRKQSRERQTQDTIRSSNASAKSQTRRRNKCAMTRRGLSRSLLRSLCGNRAGFGRGNARQNAKRHSNHARFAIRTRATAAHVDAMESRSRRNTSKRDKAKDKLQELQNLRTSGGRRAEQFELREEDAVYDVYEEEDYATLVQKRREEAGSFIEDDEGIGYADIGEEDWETGQYEDDAEELDNGRKRKAPATGNDRESKPRKKPEIKETGSKRVTDMFLAGAAPKNMGVRREKRTQEAAPAVDDLLDDILAGLDGEDPGQTLKPARNLSFKPKATAQPIFQPSGVDQPMEDPPFTKQVDADALLMENVPVKVESPSPPPKLAGIKVKAEVDEEESKENSASANVQQQVLPEPAAKKVRFDEPEPKDEPQKSGWQAAIASQEAGLSEVEEKHALETAAELPTSKTLPVEEDGTLPFYYMDAYEEPSVRGVSDKVFLFGKVPLGKTFVSCCVQVRNIPHALYVVPAAGVFDDGDGKLEQLEAAAENGNPDSKAELLQYLHRLGLPLKEELKSMLHTLGIKDASMKPVKRSYAFESDSIPKCSQYVMKVSYSSQQPLIPSDTRGKLFTCILGTQTSTLEALLLKRKIMGPSWLSVRRATQIPSSYGMSWCHLEVAIENFKDVTQGSSNRTPPPIVVASLNLKTIVDSRNSTMEIAAASVVSVHGVRVDGPTTREEWNSAAKQRHFAVVRRLDGVPYPSGFEDMAKRQNESEIGRRNGGIILSTQPSERALLGFMMAKLHQIDPDVIVGHNISASDLDVLLHRMNKLKVPHWSRIGRLKRTKFPNLSGGGTQYGGGASSGTLSTIAGRLLCDTYLSSRELLRQVTYTLTALANSQLGERRKELSYADILSAYGSSEKLLQVVECANYDAWLSLALMFHMSVLPLSKQLTNLSGSQWNKTLQGQRAQRIEMLLLHEFQQRKFMLPDKLSFKERQRVARAKSIAEGREEDEGEDPSHSSEVRKKGPAYSGGLVLEPKKGLYDKFVLLLDFNSLYPSIIQEYNICFTTVDRPKDGSVPSLPGETSSAAPLPSVIKKLVQRRRQVKELMKGEKDPLKKQQLDIRQQALKLTANSMYGCLGFTNSRFYAKPLAQLVTSQGREILQNTVNIVQEKLGLDVIYGDTDSIMVNTGSDDLAQVRQIGLAIKKEVNQHYKLLEIEMDGIYKSMLLLKKKKYAALLVEPTGDGSFTTRMEQKGIDIVRRDWCPLSKDCGNFALANILSGKPCEEVVDIIHEELRKVRGRLDAGEVPLNKFIITKQLTKSPEDYPDGKQQPHVQVALRRKAASKRDGVAAGETVPYIICVQEGMEEQSTSLAERARHPEEVAASSGQLVPDIGYYLSQQIHPVVSRLCASIEGTDPAHLADCLGLDSSRYHKANSGGGAAREDALLTAALTMDDEQRYKDCYPFTVQAASGEQFRFPGVSKAVESNSLDGVLCTPGSTPDKAISGSTLANQALLQARRWISEFYDGDMKCDDDVYPFQTRDVSLRRSPEAPLGSLPADPKVSGQMQKCFSESDLYTQLCYLHRLVDCEGVLKRLPESERALGATRVGAFRSTFDQAKQYAARLRDRSAYRWVQLSGLCVVAQ